MPHPNPEGHTAGKPQESQHKPHSAQTIMSFLRACSKTRQMLCISTLLRFNLYAQCVQHRPVGVSTLHRFKDLLFFNDTQTSAHLGCPHASGEVQFSLVTSCFSLCLSSFASGLIYKHRDIKRTSPQQISACVLSVTCKSRGVMCRGSSG